MRHIVDVMTEIDGMTAIFQTGNGYIGNDLNCPDPELGLSKSTETSTHPFLSELYSTDIMEMQYLSSERYEEIIALLPAESRNKYPTTVALMDIWMRLKALEEDANAYFKDLMDGRELEMIEDVYEDNVDRD